MVQKNGKSIVIFSKKDVPLHSKFYKENSLIVILKKY